MRKMSTLLFALICCLLIMACEGNPKVAKKSSEYIGMDYEAVVSELKKSGFTNIQVQEIDDLTSSDEIEDGIVTEISIDGAKDFVQGTEYEANVLVNILYHAIKKVEIPISVGEIQSYESSELADLFKKAGFENIQIEEIYDLDPDIAESEFVNEMMVDYESEFQKGDKVRYDAVVEIISHKPYEKYEVKIVVDFQPNLLFDKYDVRMSLNNESIEIEHGEDIDQVFSLKEGIYTLNFNSVESSSVKGEVQLDVHCDVEAEFDIKCHSDKIQVDISYIDNKEELAENQVKVMSSESSFRYENYEDVIKILKEWGFVNVVEKPLYDIYWGVTEEGSVESVTIAGTEDYQRGKVFDKDSEVVVSYHLREEDDPNKPKESDIDVESEEPEKQILTIENCPELVEILSNKSEYAESYVAFASKYKGYIVEFNGRIDYITKHENKKTRYDMLVSAGDYDPNSQTGPSFKFEDVGASDLGLGSLDYIEDKLPVGSNVVIRAEVEKFDVNSYIFYLDPESVTKR